MEKFLIFILVISQIVSFYFLWYCLGNLRNKKEKLNKNAVILKNIPNRISYEDCDLDCKTIYDVMESIKLENWKVIVVPSINYNDSSYEINFDSNDKKISVRSRLRLETNMSGYNPYLISFFIITENGSISTCDNPRINKDSKISTDVLIFLWDYIIEYHNNKNKESKLAYQNTINDISKKLKTLNRSRKLIEILDIKIN